MKTLKILSDMVEPSLGDLGSDAEESSEQDGGGGGSTAGAGEKGAPPGPAGRHSRRAADGLLEAGGGGASLALEWLLSLRPGEASTEPCLSDRAE